VTLFGTAESYGDGESERLLGDMLSRSQARDSIVLATKVSPWDSHMSVCEPPLKRALSGLGTDRIDRYQGSSSRPECGPPCWPGARTAGFMRAAGLLILAFILFALTDNPIVYTAHFMTPLAAILGLSDATYQRKRAHGRGRVATPAPLAPASTASIPELR
jgi:hypothetical protein